MGRKRLQRSSTETEAMKRQWAITHNETRRDAYAHDPSYREGVTAANRTAYRQRNGGLKVEICGKGHVGRETEFGSVRSVNGQLAVTFSSEEMARLLGGYHLQVMYRMQRDGRFPKPETHVDGKKGQVYSLDQAKRLLLVMVDHQSKKAYFQSDDLDTIDSLKKAMAGFEA